MQTIFRMAGEDSGFACARAVVAHSADRAMVKAAEIGRTARSLDAGNVAERQIRSKEARLRRSWPASRRPLSQPPAGYCII